MIHSKTVNTGLLTRHRSELIVLSPPIFPGFHRYDAEMHKTVILIHTLPDGTSHYDWLIDQPTLDAEHRLLTFRCQTRPDILAEPGFIGVALPNHRAMYLAYEGAISGDRGSVVRVADGEVQDLAVSDRRLQARILWGDLAVRYVGVCDEPGGGWSWEFSREEIEIELDG